MLKTYVIGKGAIGALLAARSLECGTPFHMWWRQARTEPLQVLMKNGSNFHLTHCELQQPEVLILPLKAWQIKSALYEFQQFINRDCCIVLMHNGMGTEDLALNLFPDNPVLRLSTSRAARRSEHNVIETGYGQSHAGWLRPPSYKQQKDIEQLIDKLLPPCQWHKDIRPALWQKLAINCVINPITAIEDIRNGELSQPQYQEKMSALLQEFCQVSELEGLPFSANELLQTVLEVVQLTADNYSSMHQDIHFNRHTEIDFINGYLLQVAAQHHISLPLNQALYGQIRSMETAIKD